LNKKRQDNNNKIEESEKQITELKALLRKKDLSLEEEIEEHSKLKASYDHLKGQISELTYSTK